MAKRERSVHPSAQILFDALGAGRLTRVDVQRQLRLNSRQVVSNWLAKGIPAIHIPAIAQMCGMSTDAYYAASGLPSTEHRHTIQPRSENTERLVANFEVLPPAFQEYLLLLSQEMGAYARSGLSEFARFAVAPPRGAVNFYEWGAKLNSDMAKLALAGKLGVETEAQPGEVIAP